MEFTCHLPINGLSLGQVSLNVLVEFYRKGLHPLIIPIGPIDVNSFNNPPEGFFPWLQERINQGALNHRRNNPTFKLWHIQESLESISNKQVLFTFHETDKVTPLEVNILRNNSKVLVTSDFTKGVFEEGGLENVSRVDLGFDARHYKKVERKYHNSDIIYFGLAGKLEHRKRHLDVLALWAKKYGNNPKYFLNCALFNAHLQPEVQQQLIYQALRGVEYVNINFSPYMDTNSTYNDYLNSNEIILGLSGGEGWGLPEFQSVALGKHAVILNASGYASWANEDNSVLIEPEGKYPCYDNIFFKKGAPFNQGDFFGWTEQAFYDALDKAEERVKTNKVNEAGLLLQKEFTWKKTADTILKELNEL